MLAIASGMKISCPRESWSAEEQVFFDKRQPVYTNVYSGRIYCDWKTLRFYFRLDRLLSQNIERIYVTKHLIEVVRN